MANATNTPSPALPKKDEPKLDENGNPIAATGAPAPAAPVAAPAAPVAVDPVLPDVPKGAVSRAPAPDNEPPPRPDDVPPPRPAPATLPNIALTTAQIAPNAQTSLFSNADRASKEAIEAGRNAKDIAMQSALFASHQPRHLDISGRPITSTQGPFRDDIIFDSQTEARRKANERAHNMGKPFIPTNEALTATQTPELTAQYAANTKQGVDAAKAAFNTAQGMGDTGAQEKPNDTARAVMAQSILDPNRQTVTPFQLLTQATGGREQADARLAKTAKYRAQHPDIQFSQGDTTEWDRPLEIGRNSLKDPSADAEFNRGTGVISTGKRFANSLPQEKLNTLRHEGSGHATDKKGFNAKGDFVTGKPGAPYLRQATEVMARLRQLPDLNGGGMHPSTPTQALDLLSSYGFVEPGSGQKATRQLTSENGDIKDMLADYLRMSAQEQKAWRKMASEIMPGTAQNKPFKPTDAFGGKTQVA